LKDKIVTHVFYFNKFWRKDDGGCLSILRSSDMFDEFASVSPIIGSSVVLLRSEKSWHSVSRVAKNCRRSRRSMTVTFGLRPIDWREKLRIRGGVRSAQVAGRMDPQKESMDGQTTTEV
jgi:Rps23 Pro-64 3,4-dihydroxylase Tpa1-like proline 4-hydroxylase